MNRSKRNIRMVLAEFTQEQKTTNQTIYDLIVVNTICSEVNDVKKELDNPKSILVAMYTKPIQQFVKKGFTDVNDWHTTEKHYQEISGTAIS